MNKGKKEVNMLGVLYLTPNQLVTFNMNKHFQTYLGNVGQVSFFFFLFWAKYTWPIIE